MIFLLYINILRGSVLSSGRDVPLLNITSFSLSLFTRHFLLTRLLIWFQAPIVTYPALTIVKVSSVVLSNCIMQIKLKSVSSCFCRQVPRTLSARQPGQSARFIPEAAQVLRPELAETQTAQGAEETISLPLLQSHQVLPVHHAGLGRSRSASLSPGKSSL